MRILLLAHAFNGLTQRLYVELCACGHEVSVEFDISDSVTEEAVALFRPQLIVAPYLRRAIPETGRETSTPSFRVMRMAVSSAAPTVIPA